MSGAVRHGAGTALSLDLDRTPVRVHLRRLGIAENVVDQRQ
jgi:hypothetical protein